MDENWSINVFSALSGLICSTNQSLIKDTDSYLVKTRLAEQEISMYRLEDSRQHLFMWKRVDWVQLSGHRCIIIISRKRLKY